MTPSRPSLFGMTPTAWSHWLSPKNPDTATVRVRQLFRAIYRYESLQEGCAAENVALKTQKRLEEGFDWACPVVATEWESSEMDGSVKFLMGLQDGLKVETVLIPERGRLTLCLSTQVGCAQGCRFCQTGRMGLMRSLEAHEIVGQYKAALQFLKSEHGAPLRDFPGISNIVFMGMGEPLDNLAGVLPALEIFTSGYGWNISHRKITVSTVGVLPQLEELLLASKCCVALSLHNPFEAERSRIMPVNERFPLHKVLDVLRAHSSIETSSFQRDFMIQYTVIRGVNDTPDHAAELGRLLTGISCKINLIPLNEHEGTAYRRPDLGKLYAFQKALQGLGFVTTVRLSKGRDIQAACGQLIRKKSSAAAPASD